MATLKEIKRNRRSESLRGSVMVDTVRGQLRVRAWPKKRGTPKSALQRWWIDWFKQANKLAKYVDAHTARRAIELTAGTGMYPRDIILSAMRGRLYSWQDSTGRKWRPMAAIQDISDSLDILTQDVASVLVRAADRWRNAGPDAPAAGHVLTYVSAVLPPVWAGAGSGVLYQDVAGTPIVPDNTQSQYDVDVGLYADLDLIFEDVGIASSASIWLRYSTDGGVTFKAGAADYFATYLTPSVGASAYGSAATVTYGASATNHSGVVRLSGLRAARASFLGDATTGTGNTSHRSSRATFAGPITHLRIMSSNAANFNAGTFRLAGIVAA